MEDGAFVRAFVTQLTLRGVRRMPSGPSAAILDAIGPSLVAEVEASSRIGWVDLGRHMAILEAIRRVAGDDGIRSLHRSVAIEGVRGPILRGFFESAMRVFGVTPEAMVRWSPRAWSVVCRAVCTLANRMVAPNAAICAVEGFPRPLFQSGTFALAYAGALEAYFPLTRTAGAVTLLALDRARGRAEYHVEWVA